ncbi:MAG: glycosyltransferase [Desulfobacteraceae bacterium]|nr:glycosyltransferase [Desulfobacteraceae bacterium]MBC2718482.1 glycosyltransferase [Desulfobacteraceae bacterium]
MRIVFVSTYPPIECGIGTYTSFLVEALARLPSEIHIISQNGAEGRHVYPSYSSEEDGIAGKIFNTAIKITPDLVHIQHEFGLYGELDGIAVLELIYRLKSTGTPVIATFHTVRKELEFRKKLILRTMCRELNGIIVHEQEHVDILRTVFDTDQSKIFLIPHGARNMDPIPDAKKKLDLEGRKVILLAGYFRPTKCFDRIVELFPQIVKKVPDAWLVLSGKLRVLEFSIYRKMLFEKINNSPVRDHIEVFRGQFPQKTFDTILSAADIVVLPYTEGAQSGIMAHAMTFGKPLVTSNLPAFVDILERLETGFYAQTDDEYVDRIVTLLTDRDVYKKFSQNALTYIKENISWDIVARQTLNVYEQFGTKLECKTRYVFAGE